MSADLATALALAKRGFRVFPLEPDGRVPAITRWPERATTDPATIERWWRCPIMGWEADWGVGVATGGDLVVVDLDVKNENNGVRAFEAMALMYGGAPATLRVRTPSGGLHLYFRTEQQFRNSASKIAPGVDIRGEGGYVVGPGTVIGGKTYEILA